MNAHTKQQQDKVFERDFIDSQKSDPPFAHLFALSHMALHEVTQCLVVWCTQNVPGQHQFHVAPAMPALEVHHFGGHSKTCFKKLVSGVGSQVTRAQ